MDNFQQCVLIILVLFVVCYYFKDSEGFSGNSVREVNDLDTGANPMSDYGRGVLNAKLRDQYEDVIEGEVEDWGASAQKISLEREVFDSQQEYTENIGMGAGASALATRSDDNDVVPWIGLRRPDYQSVYAGDDRRTVHSEYPDQMPENNRSCLI